MNDKKVKAEYKRLQDLFKSVDENKAKLVDELLMKAAFLKVQLDELEVTLKIMERFNIQIKVTHARVQTIKLISGQ